MRDHKNFRAVCLCLLAVLVVVLGSVGLVAVAGSATASSYNPRYNPTDTVTVCLSGPNSYGQVAYVDCYDSTAPIPASCLYQFDHEVNTEQGSASDSYEVGGCPTDPKNVGSSKTGQCMYHWTMPSSNYWFGPDACPTDLFVDGPSGTPSPTPTSPTPTSTVTPSPAMGTHLVWVKAGPLQPNQTNRVGVALQNDQGTYLGGQAVTVCSKSLADGVRVCQDLKTNSHGLAYATLVPVAGYRFTATHPATGTTAASIATLTYRLATSVVAATTRARAVVAHTNPRLAAAVQLQRRSSAGRYVTVRDMTTTASGVGSFAQVTPGTYRVYMPAQSGRLAATSHPVTIPTQ